MVNMSLYDGLESDPGSQQAAKDVSGWGSSVKLLKTHQKELQAKKQNALLGGSRKRHTPTVTPVMDLRAKKSSSSELSPVYFNQITGKMEREALMAARNTPSMFIGVESTAISSTFLGVTDEYDPLHPNDYEEHAKKVKEKRQKEREEERAKEMEERERRRRERHGDRGNDDDMMMDDRRKPRDDDDEEDEEEAKKYERIRSGGGGGAAIAPPPSLMEQDKSSFAPQMEDDGPTGIGPGGFGFMSKGGSVAAKIMSKMGYREGQGLGKKEQGMSTALQVEKTGKRAGKIIHERDLPKDIPRIDSSNTNILKNPSKVVLLRNMVGPGEVDEELEQETMDECQKYGKCLKCVIFEIPGTSDDEAVRIFVEFEKIDSAIKAIIDLNGRFFGGRTVKACFYNLDKYRRLDLADQTE